MSIFNYTNQFYNTSFAYDMDTEIIHIITPTLPDLFYSVQDRTYSLVDGTIVTTPEMNSYYCNEIEIILYRAKYPEN